MKYKYDKEKLPSDEEMEIFDLIEYTPRFTAEEWIESLRGEEMSNFSYILETYPKMNRAYFYEMAEIFDQLENKDQIELFKYFHNNYTTKKRDEWNIDDIMHILRKLPFEDQMEIVIFFQQLYDPEVMVNLNE